MDNAQKETPPENSAIVTAMAYASIYDDGEPATEVRPQHQADVTIQGHIASQGSHDYPMTIAKYEQEFRRNQELQAAHLRKTIARLEKHKENLNSRTLQLLEGYRKELVDIETSQPPDLIQLRIRTLQNYIDRNGHSVNVAAAIKALQAGDAVFADPARTDTLIMANGIVIGRAHDIESMDRNEFEKLEELAQPHQLWFEDPVTAEDAELASRIYTQINNRKTFMVELQIKRRNDQQETNVNSLHFVFDTGCTHTLGYRDDIDQLYGGAPPGDRDGTAITTLADGSQQEREYFFVDVRVIGNNGDPFTKWGRAKYYIKPGAKPDGDTGRLTSIPIRQTYGAFQPQDNRLIFANTYSHSCPPILGRWKGLYWLSSPKTTDLNLYYLGAYY